MYQAFQKHLQQEISDIRAAGLYKNERVITSPQDALIKIADGREMLNFCANNYLGLSDHPEIKKAATQAIEDSGYGMSSVRFICGTQDLHKRLEAAISQFAFEPLLTSDDAIISDSLNHASIIDGVRLCKAARYRYANADMQDLETQLQAAQAQRFRLIVTDAVFSMDGNVAPMDEIYALAQKYDD